MSGSLAGFRSFINGFFFVQKNILMIKMFNANPPQIRYKMIQKTHSKSLLVSELCVIYLLHFSKKKSNDFFFAHLFDKSSRLTLCV